MARKPGIAAYDAAALVGSVPRTFFAIAAPPAELPRHDLDDVLEEVLEFWLRAAGGAPPTRRMIDPVALRRVLPHLILWDVLPNLGGYRCRLAGTEIFEAAERELRGATLEENVWPGQRGRPAGIR